MIIIKKPQHAVFRVSRHGKSRLLSARARTLAGVEGLSGGNGTTAWRYSLWGALQFHDSIMAFDWPNRKNCHYLTEIVSWLRFADAIFGSDKRYSEIRLHSQASCLHLIFACTILDNLNNNNNYNNNNNNNNTSYIAHLSITMISALRIKI